MYRRGWDSMKSTGASRREMLGLMGGGMAAGLLPAAPVRAQAPAFSREMVVNLARDLATRPFTRPASPPAILNDLDYTRYRQIRFRPDASTWRKAATKFSIQYFAPGYLYRDLIDIDVVENGRATPAAMTAESFEAGDDAIARAILETGKFSGFRLHYPINDPETRNEFAVFQGASYFRAVAADQVYGLSARGLALDVGNLEGGEEHPLFRHFWIERPSAGANGIVVHALLDSESVTGAYRFRIFPGSTTRMEVDASLFPRVELTHVGLGPLTSMFMHAPLDPPALPDYRPAVHDSQALAILTGNGEALWRPLHNPSTLQISAFGDNNPKGFGLIQRARAFSEYNDLEADYGRRPSAWVAPRGDWGRGHVNLIEIPSEHEGNDNIVAYWRPEAARPAGQRHDFGYTLSWTGDVPDAKPGSGRVLRTSFGRRLGSRMPQMVIDYDLPMAADDVVLEVSASAGSIQEAFVADNPQTGGLRAFVTFDPDDAPVSELRVQPRSEGKPVGETWLYRWLPR